MTKECPFREFYKYVDEAEIYIEEAKKLVIELFALQSTLKPEMELNTIEEQSTVAVKRELFSFVLEKAVDTVRKATYENDAVYEEDGSYHSMECCEAPELVCNYRSATMYEPAVSHLKACLVALNNLKADAWQLHAEFGLDEDERSAFRHELDELMKEN